MEARIDAQVLTLVKEQRFTAGSDYFVNMNRPMDNQIICVENLRCLQLGARKCASVVILSTQW